MDIDVRNNKQVVFLVSFLDALAASTIAPLLNTHLRSVGYSNFLSGIIVAVYPCAQLLFSPIIGHYSDLYGRKILLLACMTLCSIGYTLQGVYNGILWILTCRLLVGSVKHTQLICKAILEDYDESSNDAFYGDYGKLNGYTSIGFTIGPLVGGYLIDNTNGFYYLSIYTGFIFSLNSLIVYCYFSDHSRAKKLQCRKIDIKNRTLLSDMKRIQWTGCWDIFLLKFLTTFAVLIFLSNFSLFIKEKYRVDSRFVGYIYSFRGAVGTITGLSINTWSKWVPEQLTYYRKLQINCIILSLMCAAQFFITNVYLFIFTLIPFSVCVVFIRVTSNEYLLQKTNAENRGLVLGNFNNVSSISRIAVPVVVGIFLDVYGYDCIYLLCVIGYMSTVIIAHYRGFSVSSEKIANKMQ